MISLLADERRARHEKRRGKEVWKGSMPIWGKGLFVIGGLAGWVTFLL